MQSTADLNAAADKQAELYTHVALLTSEDLDGSNVASGGTAQAITYGDAGVAGPSSEQPAVDGIAWSGVNSFTLAEVATHAGFIRGGVVHYTEPVGRLGPGVVPFVHGIGPSAVSA